MDSNGMKNGSNGKSAENSQTTNTPDCYRQKRLDFGDCGCGIITMSVLGEDNINTSLSRRRWSSYHYRLNFSPVMAKVQPPYPH
jgi:hypothetical protein